MNNVSNLFDGDGHYLKIAEEGDWTLDSTRGLHSSSLKKSKIPKKKRLAKKEIKKLCPGKLPPLERKFGTWWLCYKFIRGSVFSTSLSSQE